MADPGTLIPSDAAGSHIEYEMSFSPTAPLAADPFPTASSSGVSFSFEEESNRLTTDNRSKSNNLTTNKPDVRSEVMPSSDLIQLTEVEEGSKKSSDRSPGHVGRATEWESPLRTNQSHMLFRSPSWTEGISSPEARKMKVKDVSQYMIDAAKENPQLAQKLHDVLLESGVVAPPNLFTEVYQEQLNIETAEPKSPSEDDERSAKTESTLRGNSQGDIGQALFLPPLPYHGAHSKGGHYGQSEDKSDSKVGERFLSPSELAPLKYVRNVPVAAAAAAAAVVASSMVVAAARTNRDSNLELPVAAAATATAAAVVATTAAVGRQFENLDAYSPGAAAFFDQLGRARSDADADAIYDKQGSGDQVSDDRQGNPDGERISDRSTGNDSIKSDISLDDVSDCEIPWEDITLGERIGLGTNLHNILVLLLNCMLLILMFCFICLVLYIGSYGEVYRGDWHGTVRSHISVSY